AGHVEAFPRVGAARDANAGARARNRQRRSVVTRAQRVRRIRRERAEPLDGAVEHDASLTQNCHRRAQLLDLEQIVTAEHDRRATAPPPPPPRAAAGGRARRPAPPPGPGAPVGPSRSNRRGARGGPAAMPGRGRSPPESPAPRRSASAVRPTRAIAASSAPCL